MVYTAGLHGWSTMEMKLTVVKADTINDPNHGSEVQRLP